MFYGKFLRTHKKCPFCANRQEELIQNKTAYLTYAIAPYSRYHLLVVPKRHVVEFLKLRPSEEKDIAKLLDTGAKILGRLKVRDWTILVRNGNENHQKSVDHLHYNLIPSHRIGDLDHRGRQRRVLTETEVGSLVRKIKSLT